MNLKESCMCFHHVPHDHSTKTYKKPPLYNHHTHTSTAAYPEYNYQYMSTPCQICRMMYSMFIKQYYT